LGKSSYQSPLFGSSDLNSPILSVVIPTMNEPLIQPLVERVHESLNFVDHEIVVVDNSDQSPVLASARVFRQNSRGLGRAVLEGVAAARGGIVAIMDGDFSHRPQDLATMVKRLGSHDFVLGSRYVSQGKNLDIPYRRAVSMFFNRIARLFLGLEFADPMSGFIVIRKALFVKARPNPIGFKLNLELIYKSRRLGFNGTESPITFVPRLAGKSKAGLREAIRTLSYILTLRLREW